MPWSIFEGTNFLCCKNLSTNAGAFIFAQHVDVVDNFLLDRFATAVSNNVFKLFRSVVNAKRCANCLH